MIPSRSRWEPYLQLAEQMSRRYGVPTSLILATMYAESNFDPNAYRDEPQIGDASRGLMQLLLMTARGLGFSATPDRLFDPATNADLGTKLLWQNIVARSGDLAKAVSQYNGGYRPSLGFGEPFASGQFKNQAYVNKVLTANVEFQTELAKLAGAPIDTGSTGPGPGSGPATQGPSAAVWITLGGALIAAALAYLFGKR